MYIYLNFFFLYVCMWNRERKGERDIDILVIFSHEIWFAGIQLISLHFNILWYSLNHSSIQPTNKMNLLASLLIHFTIIIGTKREERAPIWSNFKYSSSFCFFFVINYLFVIANILTELSWLDMDVWWDIGNRNVLARRSCIP